MNAATAIVPLVGDEIKFTERQIKNFWRKVDKNGPLPDQSNPHYAGLGQCWVWTGCISNKGYGTFGVNGKSFLAHRVAWMMANGPIPNDGSRYGLHVMHLCDRPTCCRVDHIRLGSHTDNMHDMGTKGRNRQPSGDANGSRVRPERLARGDNHPARRRPDYLLRGDSHPSRLHPECLARGDANGSRTHPEKLKRGEHHHKAKLTTEDILDIRAKHATGSFTQKMLGAQFGVSHVLIGLIVRRKIWSHVADEWI